MPKFVNDRGVTTAADPRRLVWVGNDTCGYWTDDWALLKRTPSGKPCCPSCRMPGMVIEHDRFEQAVAAADLHDPGYAAFVSGHKLVCFKMAGGIENAWRAHRGPRPDDGPRAEAMLGMIRPVLLHHLLAKLDELGAGNALPHLFRHAVENHGGTGVAELIVHDRGRQTNLAVAVAPYAMASHLEKLILTLCDITPIEPGDKLYERCPNPRCSARCPLCNGHFFVPIGVTAGQLARLADTDRALAGDPGLSAAVREKALSGVMDRLIRLWLKPADGTPKDLPHFLREFADRVTTLLGAKAPATGADRPKETTDGPDDHTRR